jgi:hypothetical protein
LIARFYRNPKILSIGKIYILTKYPDGFLIMACLEPVLITIGNMPAKGVSSCENKVFVLVAAVGDR